MNRILLVIVLLASSAFAVPSRRSIVLSARS
jgi:hypothetical protein